MPGAPGDEEVELLIPQREVARGVAQGAAAGFDNDPRSLSKPSQIEARHQDTQLTGEHGKGPTRSQVILDAADRGFATASYERVYADYRSHAEEVIERDEVPAGYRFYVRRYFQLIRPRDE
jgi:hypothetical protein